nr:MAG: hypothetical protein 1 [Leviviridae sp.]
MGRARDIGGPFFSRKVSVTANNHVHSLRTVPGNVTGTYLYSGPIYPSYGSLEHSRRATEIYDGKFRNSGLWTSDNALSRGNLQAEGLKFMVAASPTSPAYSMANSLGELISERALFGLPLRAFERDGEGALPGEYLNLQFGILPVVSDVREYLLASERSEAILSQLVRDNGRVIRRRREKPVSVSTTTEEYVSSHVNGKLIAPPSTVLDSGLYQNGKLHVAKKTSRQLWFTGAYEYFLPPESEGFLRALVERNAVYGYLPSPELIWELTPFSWLSDWALNTSDLVSGAFGVGPDGSVLIRGYVMCKTVTKTEMTWIGRLAVNGSWRLTIMSWVVEETILQRERARSYGVDWKLDGLTAKQLSILTALGLSVRR